MMIAPNTDAVETVVQNAATLDSEETRDFAVELFHDYYHTLHFRFRRKSDGAVTLGQFIRLPNQPGLHKLCSDSTHRKLRKLRKALKVRNDSRPLPPIAGDGLVRIDLAAKRAALVWPEAPQPTTHPAPTSIYCRGQYWTISSLKAKLAELEEEHGDLIVYADDNSGESGPTPEELVINLTEDGEVVLGTIAWS